MVFTITAGVASVMILRPLTKQLGQLLEQMRRDRQLGAQQPDPARMAELMERLLDRLERLEARQDSTERVLESAGWKAEGARALSEGLATERQGQSGGS
jgi:hypothetical protein